MADYYFFTMKNTLFYITTGGWNSETEETDPVAIYKIVNGTAILVFDVNVELGLSEISSWYASDIYIGTSVLYVAVDAYDGEESKFGLIKFTV
jgi:hypothetical protein